MPLESTFSYSNAPQAILPKKKYRGEEEGGFTLMSDPRVVRGSATRGKGGGQTARVGPGRTSGGEQQREREQREERGRSHVASYQYKVAELVRPEIDLSQYLVERTDEGADRRRPREAESQTDRFQERPQSPEYVPRKTGVDATTQVDDVSELFVFDLEVEPLLGVLCAKTLEQALLELQCEGELEGLQQEAARCEEQRLGEQEWRVAREQETHGDSCIKDLALKGLQGEARRQREVRGKVAGLAAMRQMLPSLLEDVSRELYAEGVWRDPLRRLLQDEVLPGVYAAAGRRLQVYEGARALVDGECREEGVCVCVFLSLCPSART